MIQAVLQFFGSGQDEFGMPEPFHAYFITAYPWPDTENNGSIVVVETLTKKTPKIEPLNPELFKDQNASFERAVEALKQLPENIELKNILFHIPK